MSHELTTLLAQANGEDLRVIKSLTKASADTIDCWVKGERLPKGELRIRLHGALHLLRRTITEFDELPEPARKLTMIITLDVLSVDEIVGYLGYTTASQLYRVLLAGTSLTASRAAKMVELVREYYPLAEEATRSISDKSGRGVNAKTDPSLETVSPRSSNEGDAAAKVTAHLIEALAILTQQHNNAFVAQVANLTQPSAVKTVAKFLVTVATE